MDVNSIVSIVIDRADASSSSSASWRGPTASDAQARFDEAANAPFALPDERRARGDAARRTTGAHHERFHFELLELSTSSVVTVGVDRLLRVRCCWSRRSTTARRGADAGKRTAETTGPRLGRGPRRNTTTRCRAGGCGCSTSRSSSRVGLSGRCIRASAASGGVLGWTLGRRSTTTESADADAQATAALRRSTRRWTSTAVAADPQARAMGERLFLNNCAQCHGSDARRRARLSQPDRQRLALRRRAGDDRGDRSPNGRNGVMPPLGAALGDEGVKDVGALRALAVGSARTTRCSAQRGKPMFEQNCAACHGADGKGNQALGAPNLTDDIWLYGGARGDDRRDHHQRAQRAVTAARRRCRRTRTRSARARSTCSPPTCGACRTRRRRSDARAARYESDAPIESPIAGAGVRRRSSRSTRSARRSIRARCTAGSRPGAGAGRCSRSSCSTACRGSRGTAGRRCCSTSPRASSTSSALVFWPQDIIYLTVAADHLGALAVPVHRGRRPPVVRLRLPADRLHRDLHVDRAQDRRRPRWRACKLDGEPLSARKARHEGAEARRLDRARAVDRASPSSATSRRSATSRIEVLACRTRAVGNVLDPVLRLRHLRQRRLDARAGVQVHVPVRALPERDVRPDTLVITYDRGARRAARRAQPQGRPRRPRASATASTAASACRCARPASTSATACSTNASAAPRASTAATR